EGAAEDVQAGFFHGSSNFQSKATGTASARRTGQRSAARSQRDGSGRAADGRMMVTRMVASALMAMCRRWRRACRASRGSRLAPMQAASAASSSALAPASPGAQPACNTVLPWRISVRPSKCVALRVWSSIITPRGGASSPSAHAASTEAIKNGAIAAPFRECCDSGVAEARTRGIFPRLGFVDAQRATADVLAIVFVDRVLGGGIVRHFDKSEVLGAMRHLVDDDLRRIDLA